jgi:type IV pilus assembly protein PilP
MALTVTLTLNRFVVALVLVLAAGRLAAAQGAPAAPVNPSAGGAAPAAPTATPPPAPDPYTYDPAGRRDPFISLLSRGMEPVSGKKSAGLAGVTTSELMLRGVMESRGAYVAMVGGPDGKTYTARVNDRLLDGVIRSVTPQGIIIMQDVNDPLSLVKQREVRKGLRTAEDAK